MALTKILVVDDEASARNALAELLADSGYEVETAADGFKALARVSEFSPHLVLTDLQMPGMNGIDLLRKVRAHDDQVPIVLMTAHGGVDSAVSAMREGAADYLSKPLNFDELLLVLERALDHGRLQREASQLRSQLSERYKFENIVGNSTEMQQVFKTIAQVAPSRATVLITGQSGTGKELVAAAIHHRSTRAGGPFVRLHCAALAESLLESELFGHERGAFTGADRRREGRFEQANGGTLFLDEIGEISLATQVKLLRVLQEREFERVGGNSTIQVDVRVVAATNKDLKELVAQGKFREDLFYRLNVINLRLPALWERQGDITPLAMHFLRRFATENGKSVESISDEALARLVAYRWPGNVRELENVIERAVVICIGPRIELEHLPAEVGVAERRDDTPIVPGASLDEIERHAIMRTLEATGGSTSKAAEILGISVRKIQYRLHEYSSAERSGVPSVAPRDL